MRSLFFAALLLPSLAVAQPVSIPPENRASIALSPPPRPGMGTLETRMRALLDAIVADTPQHAQTTFLSRDAFRHIKGIADPDSLFTRLYAAYERDIHALHQRLAAEANGQTIYFVRFEFSRRRAWVTLREESNRLPYWAQRHNFLVYRIGNQEHRIEVRTMITWGTEWFITHLSEFH